MTTIEKPKPVIFKADAIKQYEANFAIGGALAKQAFIRDINLLISQRQELIIIDPAQKEHYNGAVSNGYIMALSDLKTKLEERTLK